MCRVNAGPTSWILVKHWVHVDASCFLGYMPTQQTSIFKIQIYVSRLVHRLLSWSSNKTTVVQRFVFARSIAQTLQGLHVFINIKCGLTININFPTVYPFVSTINMMHFGKNNAYYMYTLKSMRIGPDNPANAQSMIVDGAQILNWPCVWWEEIQTPLRIFLCRQKKFWLHHSHAFTGIRSTLTVYHDDITMLCYRDRHLYI